MHVPARWTPRGCTQAFGQETHPVLLSPQVPWTQYKVQQGGGLLVFGNRRLRPGAYRSHDVLSYQNFGSLFTMVNPDEPLENLSYYRPLGQWLPETNDLERVPCSRMAFFYQILFPWGHCAERKRESESEILLSADKGSGSTKIGKRDNFVLSDSFYSLCTNS